MDFLTLYPLGRNLFIEILCDKYVTWQPQTAEQLDARLDDITKIISELKQYCAERDMFQVAIINFNKAIQFDKINYVLAAKMCSRLIERFPDTLLKRVEFQHANPIIHTIYESVQFLLPKKLTRIIMFV
jgi:hypothetical protein